MTMPLKNFTHPSFPDYHNQPFKLTTEEIDNPYVVIDEFFESYHLTDIRACLESWLHDGLFAENIDSKIHFSTHEKIVKLGECCWVIRYSLEEPNDQKALPISEPITEPNEILDKHPQLIEWAESDPLFVITDVFKCESLPFLRDQLHDWLFVGLSADSSIYDNGEQRKQLLFFQDQFLVLIEALFIIYTNREKKVVNDNDKPRLLSQDQVANPMQVLTGFFEKFPMAYVIRELNDWLEAGIAYAGDYPDNMSELQTLYTYRNALCLIKSANAILNTPKFQP